MPLSNTDQEPSRYILETVPNSMKTYSCKQTMTPPCDLNEDTKSSCNASIQTITKAYDDSHRGMGDKMSNDFQEEQSPQENINGTQVTSKASRIKHRNMAFKNVYGNSSDETPPLIGVTDDYVVQVAGASFHDPFAIRIIDYDNPEYEEIIRQVTTLQQVDTKRTDRQMKLLKVVLASFEPRHVNKWVIAEDFIRDT